MISNPCQWFISGSEKDEFRYEGGTTLFHFSCENLIGFERHMFMNCVFFANNETHAADVLERMLTAYINGVRKRSKTLYQGESGERINSRTKFLEDILAQKELWEFSKAPTDQFYIVGWASNDTLV